MTQVREMLRGGNLREAEDFLQVTNAKRGPGQQMDDAESSPVAKTIVDLD